MSIDIVSWVAVITGTLFIVTGIFLVLVVVYLINKFSGDE
jgi:hypothetical protein